jgi:hypothetical protein
VAWAAASHPQLGLPERGLAARFVASLARRVPRPTSSANQAPKLSAITATVGSSDTSNASTGVSPALSACASNSSSRRSFTVSGSWSGSAGQVANRSGIASNNAPCARRTRVSTGLGATSSRLPTWSHAARLGGTPTVVGHGALGNDVWAPCAIAATARAARSTAGIAGSGAPCSTAPISIARIGWPRGEVVAATSSWINAPSSSARCPTSSSAAHAARATASSGSCAATSSTACSPALCAARTALTRAATPPAGNAGRVPGVRAAAARA